MRYRLLSRTAKLEARPEYAIPSYFRYGFVSPLPAEYTGERHIEIVSRQPTDRPFVELCEFEERPGPAPAGKEDNSFLVLCTR